MTICPVCNGSGIDSTVEVEAGKETVPCTNCGGNGKIEEVASE